MAGAAGSEKSVYVTVSVLDAGHITLPDYLFVAGADPNVRTTVPSLSFLVQHPSPPASRHANVTNLVFDLGVKRDLSSYPIAQQPHVAARRPIITDPDCSASLRKGASNEGGDRELLNPETEIDFVILSHVHWDHIGTPSDFSSAIFVVGSGTLGLLRNGAGPYYPAEQFNPDELPVSRTVELPPDPSQGSSFQEYYAGQDTPVHTPTPAGTQAKLPSIADEWSWQPFGGFPRTIDFFGDQSVYVVDSPGHIYGHVNLLVRISDSKYVYLGGDCCHDTRLLSGEKEIAEYDDGRGGIRSVHVHTGLAKKTLAEIDAGINQLRQEMDVEVVLAHDKEWRERNRHRFWPGKL
ncbi:hypothetical protein NUW58_g1841 [Xylaria curta]|uniref:Uncharacterized protein n=1 Tax=Xylaria curta TaxID=42375 RepID=A0ACC1PL55_9PEZI|nr:hypothetical protein NUW58_g1841 [Xylaria curta]